MRLVLFLCLLSVTAALAETGPTDPKAQKSYAEAERYLKQHRYEWALDSFKKAARQDGHCIPCEQQIIHVALQTEDYKAAMAAGQELITLVKNPQDIATAHYFLGAALLRAGAAKHKDELFSQADEQFKAALQVDPKLHEAVFADGMALAWMNRDEPAKARFAEYLKVAAPDSIDTKRASRFMERPELVRARMAPAFDVKTLDGRRVSLDDLAGKVVLIDFWATWCGPCREALPRVQKIPKEFSGQPLVILSVSLDNDDAKWRDFVEKHEMTWLQYRDGGFDGRISTLFSVRAIPSTFTIDADGVLQDQHVGDADIEGKLKKLTARAVALQSRTQTAALPAASVKGVN